MIESLLKELEDLVGSDYFEFDSEEITDKIESEGAGPEIIEDLLGIMERHPLEDFGMPGAMVHFIEKFDPEYIPILIKSIQRRPSIHTVWMLNRCINGTKDADKYIDLLKAVSEDESLEEDIRDSALEFYEYQMDE